MKNRILQILLISCILGASACAGGYVSEQPAGVVYNRPPIPGDGYIWIDGDWVWGGGRYQWHEGHWDRPRAGHNWVGGRWQSSGKGYRWQRGRWN